jgi:hypothetical protein
MLDNCHFLRLSLFSMLVLFPANTAFGFCFKPSPTVSCEFLNSDAVFSGKVISVRAISDGQFADGWYYRVRVEQHFRGPRTPVVEVYTGNDSGRFPLQTGDEYLLFARTYKGLLEIANCGNSALLSEATGAIRELEKLSIPQDACIEGRISFSGIPDTGSHVSGVHILIKGEGTSYNAISDRDGWFRLHLPPGKYSAEIEQIPHWNIVAYDLSFADPNHFVANRGRCIGLQFLAAAK